LGPVLFFFPILILVFVFSNWWFGP